MSKSNALETQWLQKFFNNTTLPFDAAAGFYIALHSADPGEGGVQSDNEVAYAGYARVLVARDSGGWTISGNTASNTAQVQFPECTGGAATCTHFSIGAALAGDGQIHYRGALPSSLAISNQITPQFAPAVFGVIED